MLKEILKMATLINGNGNAAVYAQQDADLYVGALGNTTRILDVGSKMAATIEDANTIAIADGVILTKEGRRIQVDVGAVDEFTIPTGQAGTTRYYIIGYHLYTDGSANQKCETFVQLMSSSSETIPEGTFRSGANEVYVSVYRVQQDSLTLQTPEALLALGESIGDLEAEVAQISASLTEYVRYNPETDWTQIKVNGVWTNWLKAGMQVERVFYNGQYGEGYSTGDAFVNPGQQSTTYPMQIQGSSLVIPNPYSLTVYANGGNIISPAIDLSNYSTITINFSINNVPNTYNIDVSGLTSSAYIGLGCYRTSGTSTDYAARFGVFRSNDLANSIIYQDYVVPASSAVIAVQEVYMQ